MDGEYDSRRGGLLLDGGQEGKLTFTPEELHHPLRDVCRGVNSSPDIWMGEKQQKEKMVRPWKLTDSPSAHAESASNIIPPLIRHGETRFTWSTPLTVSIRNQFEKLKVAFHQGREFLPVKNAKRHIKTKNGVVRLYSKPNDIERDKIKRDEGSWPGLTQLPFTCFWIDHFSLLSWYFHIQQRPPVIKLSISINLMESADYEPISQQQTTPRDFLAAALVVMAPTMWPLSPRTKDFTTFIWIQKSVSTTKLTAELEKQPRFAL